MKTMGDKLWNSNYLKIWTGNFLLNFSFTLIVPLLPLYLSDTFGATNDAIGMALAGYTVMALIILIGTVGAFTLFLEGINKLGAVRATLIGCLEPVSATVISALWLGSVFSLTDILGFVCILATVLIFNTGEGSDKNLT